MRFTASPVDSISMPGSILTADTLGLSKHQSAHGDSSKLCSRLHELLEVFVSAIFFERNDSVFFSDRDLSWNFL